MELLFVVLAALIVGVIVLSSVTDARTRRANLERLAGRHGGRVTSAWLSDTDLEFTVDGAPAHLSYHLGSKNSAPYTRLRFKSPFGTRLRVAPEGFWESLKKAFGAEDLELGDPDFDRDYIVQGFPASWVRRVLGADTRRRIRRLAALAGGRVAVEAGPLGLLVAVQRMLVEDAPALERFVQEAIALSRDLREPPDAGIQFLSAPELVAEGSCPVCGHPLGERPRRCGACATPHHPDCWAYFGGCSTYACGENP